jgi:FKBP-type peptidyl-prolyl cis-trans isomerase FklB
MTRPIMKILPGALGLWIGFAVAAPNNALPTETDRVSYALGVETGKSFKNHGISINATAFSQGIQDAMNGNQTLMTDDEINQTLKNFQRTASAKLQAQMQQSGQKNKQFGSAFLDANKERPGVTTTQSGLQYKVITPATGPKPGPDDVVTVDYEGRLLDGKVFDSSYERGVPASFPVKGVIQGWQEALQLMPVGSTYELYIPSKLAYGEDGAQGVIGPNETLIFKVHLIKIQNQNKAQETAKTTGQ